MRVLGAAVVGIGVLAFGGTALAVPTPVGLGAATNAAVVSGAQATNTGTTNITGDVSTAPNPVPAGFGPCPAAGCVNFTAGQGALHPDDALAIQEKAAADASYVHTSTLGGAKAILPQLGGTTLPAGLYSAGAIDITGTLTLDAAMNPNSVWIFQAASSITTAATNSNVVFTNIPPGSSFAQLACNVFWTAVSSATLNAGTTFVGTIMAAASISVKDGVTVTGRLLADGAGTGAGSVTLVHDTINRPSCTVLPAGTGGEESGGGSGGGLAVATFVTTPPATSLTGTPTLAG